MGDLASLNPEATPIPFTSLALQFQHIHAPLVFSALLLLLVIIEANIVDKGSLVVEALVDFLYN